MAILRFSDFTSPYLTTTLVSTSKSFDNLEEEFENQNLRNLESIQTFAHELANPQSGVYHCNYSCSETGSSKYTSVQVNAWPEKEVTEEAEEAGEGGRKAKGAGEDAEASEQFSAVPAWRHNTMIQSTRRLVSFSEKTKNCMYRSVTLEFVFDPSTAQPVLLGVVEAKLGTATESHSDSLVPSVRDKQKKVKKKVKMTEALGASAAATGDNELFPTKWEMAKRDKERMPFGSRIFEASMPASARHQRRSTNLANAEPPISAAIHVTTSDRKNRPRTRSDSSSANFAAVSSSMNRAPRSRTTTISSSSSYMTSTTNSLNQVRKSLLGHFFLPCSR